MPEEQNLFETDRKITVNTISREAKLLNTQNISNLLKFANIYKRANMDVVDWMLENNISDWESLLKKLAEKEDDKISEVIKLCAKRRLPSENAIIFIEEVYRNFKAIQIISDEILINMILKMTWPSKPEIIDKLASSKSIPDLIERTRTMEESMKNEKSSNFCTVCKKKGHKANKCRYKTETQNGI